MDVISNSTNLLLAVSMLKGVGSATLRKVAGLVNLPKLNISEISDAIPQVARSYTDASAWDISLVNSEKQICEAAKYGARIISVCDDEYPELLRQTKDDPAILYIIGQVPRSPEKSVAVIGTRQPTEHGSVVAKRVSNYFVEKGWSVVSGLALGCDSIAHQAAIDAGGHTIAVLAHGLQTVAPSRHKKLARDIVDSGGALISEYPFGREVLPQQFVKRDRTQAGLAQGVVMIQSDVKGGSLHASRAALEYNRWLAVPYPTQRDRENGEPKIQANLLIADGEDQMRADLLRCPLRSLKKVVILRNKDDYFQLTNLNVERAASEPHGGVDLNLPTNANDKGEPLPSGLFDFVRVAALGSDDESQHRVETGQLSPGVVAKERIRIFQLPAPLTEEYRGLENLVKNRETIDALRSRLEYIQDRCDFVSLASTGGAGGDELITVPAAEEVIGQMIDVVQFLAWLSNAAANGNNQFSHASESQGSADLDDGYHSTSDILEKLKSCRNELAHWFLPERQQVSLRKGALNDLAKSFNSLLDRTLLPGKVD